MGKIIDLFYVKDEDCYTFGRNGEYRLTEPECSHEWYTEKKCILPEGYSVSMNQVGTPLIFNDKDECCPIAPDYQENPMLITREGYVKLQVIK